MYKKILFQYGAKKYVPYKKNVQSYGGQGTCCGSGDNIDNYLLSLVRGVKSLSILKTTRKKQGKGLTFVR